MCVRERKLMSPTVTTKEQGNRKELEWGGLGQGKSVDKFPTLKSLKINVRSSSLKISI